MVEAIAPTSGQPTQDVPPPETAGAPETDWRAALPEDLRNHASLTVFKAKDAAEVVPVLAKSLVNVQNMIGRDKIPMPKSDSEWEDTYVKLGRPEKPDDYKFERPKMPEGTEWDEAGEKAFRAMAHARGLNQAQAQNMLNDLVKFRMEDNQSRITAYQAQAVEQQATLKKELGQAYEPFTKAAGQVVEQYGGEAAKAAFNELGVGNHPAIVKMMGAIARELNGVSKLKGGEKSQALTPAEWDGRIAEFRSKHGMALFDNRHPDNVRLAKELADMYTQKHSGASQ